MTSQTLDRRLPQHVGRTARLDLTFAARNGRTVLARGYAEPPLRLGRCFERGDGLHLILASSAPGVFAGDDIAQHIVVHAGADVRLTSQSALQLHGGIASDLAVVATSCHVQSGAALTCLLEPVIPFAGAALTQRIQLQVENGGCLIWSDAVMCGREGRGERWQFSLLDHELALTHGQRLAYLERFRLDAHALGLHGSWAGRDHSYFGTVLAVGVDEMSTVATQLHALMSAEPAVSSACDLPEDGLLLVRMAGAVGAAFHRLRRQVHELLEQRGFRSGS